MAKFDDLTKWVKWLLYSQMAMLVIALISGAMEYRVLSDLAQGAFPSVTNAIAAAESSDNRQQVVGVLQFVVAIATAVFVLRWIHRANVNVRYLGAADMRFTPGWAVGWYFIPIANLWKPYQAMKEIWNASANPRAWNRAASPPVLVVWWILWLVSNAMGQGSFRMMLRAEEMDELLAANVVTQVSDAIDLPLCVLFLLIVSRLHAMQRKAWAESSNRAEAGTTFVPPSGGIASQR